jgi:hypothetical protein
MHAERKLVSFIGIGTSSAAPLLYSYIKAHPAVCVTEGPTNFFSNTKVYSQGIDWYESNFTKCTPNYVCGELAGDYLKNAQAAALIARNYPSAKLVAVIENPLVSVRVAYIEARRARKISTSVSLAMFLKQNPEVLTEAKYGRQLAQYFSLYSIKDLLVVTATDVREDILKVIATVYEHIGVDKNFVPVSLKSLIPVEEEIRKPGRIKRTYRMIKKLIIGTYHGILIKFNPPEVPLEATAAVARKVPISPELHAYLVSFYKQDVAMLSSLLHRNLSHEWGIGAD